MSSLGKLSTAVAENACWEVTLLYKRNSSALRQQEKVLWLRNTVPQNCTVPPRLRSKVCLVANLHLNLSASTSHSPRAHEELLVKLQSVA